nr:DUF397 domain-containing protein [Streptomyces sp. E2N166]
MGGLDEGLPSEPAQGGSCLEVADGHPVGTPVRDSKVPDGPALVFSAVGRASFITALREAASTSKA